MLIHVRGLKGLNSVWFVIVVGATPRMGETPQRVSGSITPGRASVRDKLNINPEEALMEEYEAGYGAKQQQARILSY